MRINILWFGTILLSIPPLMGQRTANQIPSEIRPDSQHSPYTAEYRITVSKTLPNGTVTRREETEIRALDSRGSFVVKHVWASRPGHQTINLDLFQRDTQTRSSWQIPGNRVTVSTSAPPITSTCFQSAIEEEWAVNRLTTTTDDLGTEIIADIPAHGKRTTAIVPTGIDGNSAPVTSTEEVWVTTEPSLNKLEVRTVIDHPLPLSINYEQVSIELINLRLGEPDALLFEPPPDYEIVTRMEQELSRPCTWASTPLLHFQWITPLKRP